MKSPLTAVALLLSAQACSSEPELEADKAEDVYQELLQRLEQAKGSKRFHFGCSERLDDTGQPRPAIAPALELHCDDESWSCGDEGLENLKKTWETTPQNLVISWLSPFTIVGAFLEVYFVNPDGSATHFYEAKTDIADSDCGSYCGWHKEEIQDFLQANGIPRIVPASTPVTEYSLCGWP